MISVENIKVFGWEAAIRGMRNPMNSWDKSDSGVCDAEHCSQCSASSEERDCSRPDGFVFGKNDMDLAKRLTKAGTEHRKFLRMIHVQMDITAPLYWWKEYDTYKVGTVSNSCSTMHKIHAKPFELDDFSADHLEPLFVSDGDKCCDGYEFRGALEVIIHTLNMARRMYLETKDKRYWWQMIQLLPSSYNQKRTVDINYEVVMAIIHQRTGHKLDEWREFIKVLENLSYMKEMVQKNNGEKVQ